MVGATVNLHLHPPYFLNQPLSHPRAIHPPIAAANLLRRRCLSIDPLLRPEKSWKLIRARGGMVIGDYGDDIEEDDDDDEEEEEDEEGSLDLLIKFVENVFRKVSRKARKAVKSVLPVPISGRLVGFAVNGTIILTFLWILKAFLQVICTLGSVVFLSILLIRGIWTGISYFQETRSYRADEDEPQLWTGSRPVV